MSHENIVRVSIAQSPCLAFIRIEDIKKLSNGSVTGSRPLDCDLCVSAWLCGVCMCVWNKHQHFTLHEFKILIDQSIMHKPWTTNICRHWALLVHRAMMYLFFFRCNKYEPCDWNCYYCVHDVCVSVWECWDLFQYVDSIPKLSFYLHITSNHTSRGPLLHCWQTQIQWESRNP